MRKWILAGSVLAAALLVTGLVVTDASAIIKPAPTYPVTTMSLCDGNCPHGTDGTCVDLGCSCPNRVRNVKWFYSVKTGGAYLSNALLGNSDGCTCAAWFACAVGIALVCKDADGNQCNDHGFSVLCSAGTPLAGVGEVYPPDRQNQRKLHQAWINAKHAAGHTPQLQVQNTDRHAKCDDWSCIYWNYPTAITADPKDDSAYN